MKERPFHCTSKLLACVKNDSQAIYADVTYRPMFGCYCHLT